MWTRRTTNDPVKVQALRGVPGLRGLRDHDLAEVARLVDEATIPAGRVLIEEGTRGDQAFLVLSGTADVLLGGELIGQVTPGDILGELAMVDLGPRSATVVAATPMRVLVV